MYPQNYYQFPNYQRQEVVKVTGKEGANALTLGCNSSVLLLDSNQPIVYLVVTDGAGYKTITSYDIVLHKEETVTPLEERVARLEALIEQSNTTGTKRKANTRQDEE